MPGRPPVSFGRPTRRGFTRKVEVSAAPSPENTPPQRLLHFQGLHSSKHSGRQGYAVPAFRTPLTGHCSMCYCEVGARMKRNEQDENRSTYRFPARRRLHENPLRASYSPNGESGVGFFARLLQDLEGEATTREEGRTVRGSQYDLPVGEGCTFLSRFGQISRSFAF